MQSSVRKCLYSRDRLFWLLLVFSSAYILSNIGSGSLTNWDEAVYANVSREILNSGNWLILHLRGNLWVDKPPLYMLATAFFYRLFGISEFSVRLTSGISAVATVMLLYVFIRNTVNKNAALLGALVLLAFPHYLHFAKLGMLDVTMTFFVVAVFYLFWKGRDDPFMLFLSGIMLLPAYFTKGFAAFLAVFIILLYAIIGRDLKSIFKRQFVYGILVSVLVIISWHCLQYLTGGLQTMKGYLGYHIFLRATQTIEGHGGGMNFYQKALFNKNMPWSILAFASIPYILWLAFKRKDKLALFLCCWAGGAYLFFSLISTKLHWYIIPVYPALAFSSALLLERLFRKEKFVYLLISVLLFMIAQTQFSWAFMLDFSPHTKNSALYAQSLRQNGAKVFVYRNEDDKEFFYYRDLPELYLLNKPETSSTLSSQTYCIIKRGEEGEVCAKFGCALEPVACFGNNIVTRIRLKG